MQDRQQEEKTRRKQTTNTLNSAGLRRGMFRKGGRRKEGKKEGKKETEICHNAK
jgi:hypothetical protein